MKISLLTLLLLASVCLAAAKESFTIRGVPWGATKGQVIHSEISEPIFQQGGSIAFEDRLAGKSVTILFEFLDDSLHRVAYQFTETYLYGQPYIDDYQVIENLIRKKYGKPTKVGLDWQTDLYDESELADAVQAGAVNFFSSWKRSDVLITHGLDTRDPFSKMHIIAYEDPAQEKKAKEKKTEAVLDDL